MLQHNRSHRYIAQTASKGAVHAEHLEPRRLLAVSFDQALGILTVTGGDEKNIVQFQVADSPGGGPATTFTVLESTTTAASPPLSFPTQQQVVDYINSGSAPVSTNFSLDAVRELRINTGGGDDLIILGQKLGIPAFINSGLGNDSVSAGVRDDTMTGGGGNDYLFGHDGNDAIGGDLGGDEILGGDDVDVADFKTRSADLEITVNNNGGDGESGEGDNVRTDIEAIIGGSGNDTIDASSALSGMVLDGAGGSDIITGSAFNDVILGAGGTDVISSGDGDDVIFDEDGNDDSVDGGAGADLSVNDADDNVSNVEIELADDATSDPATAPGGSATLTSGVLTINGTGNDDLIRLQLSQDGNSVFVIEEPNRNASDDRFVSQFTIANINSISVNLGGGSDIFHGGEVAENMGIHGGDGFDVLIGGAGNDAITGGNGNDYMFGRGGSDVLDGGANADFFSGGGDNDTADFSGRNGDVLVGIGQIPDDGERGEGDNVQLDIETVIGGSGNDRLNTQGTTGVTFIGGPGRDITTGGPGADSFGLEDNESDTARGGGGVDVLLNSDAEDDVDLQN